MAFDIGFVDLGPADVGRTPQREAPMLAKLTREMLERPLWMTRDTVPLEVDLETWKRAREEMVEIQKARGFPLAMASIDRVNFLLRGVPVVIRTDT